MIEFYKYHGAGNDFVIIDDREEIFDINDTDTIRLLCHRHFGIGADGLILLRDNKDYDFEMLYWNSDGSAGAMCGNGGRCIVHFAHHVLKIASNPQSIEFLAADGVHKAEIVDNGVRLKMSDISEIDERNGLPFLRSGSTPHSIVFVKDLKNFPVFDEGRRIRNLEVDGVNVDFVESDQDVLNVRTYERGVEDETMACGTGAACVAIASHHLNMLRDSVCHIEMPGGRLRVEFDPPVDGDNVYQNIWLSGPAECVFRGYTDLKTGSLQVLQ